MKITLLFILIIGISSDAATVWNFFKNTMRMTDEGAAGFMGNVEKESGFEARILEYAWIDEHHVSLDQYVREIKSGVRNVDKFANDRAGFGVVQWTDKDRKRNLIAN